MSLDAAAAVGQAQQVALQSQISVAIQKKQLDAVQVQGDAVNELLQNALQLSKSVGTGVSFDAQG